MQRRQGGDHRGPGGEVIGPQQRAQVGKLRLQGGHRGGGLHALRHGLLCDLERAPHRLPLVGEPLQLVLASLLRQPAAQHPQGGGLAALDLGQLGLAAADLLLPRVIGHGRHLLFHHALQERPVAQGRNDAPHTA